MFHTHAGVKGVKVKVFSTSMDTKGREELLAMQTCQSYQGCPICLSVWSPGRLVRRTQCLYDGYRQFLAPGSRARQKSFTRKRHTYEYRCVETRTKPRYRDDEFVKSAVALATNAQPFCGHKPQVPLLAGWPGWSWRRTNTPEPMHGSLTCSQP